ncbi:hypothetical protein AALA83_06220 [Oscillospiraceae bacterium 44-5]
MVDGVAGQQGLLVLDAFRLGLLLVFILLTQSCIDRAKDLLHLLQGVNAFAGQTAKASFVEFFCEPGSNSSIHELLVCFCSRYVILTQNQNRVLHQNRLQQDL